MKMEPFREFARRQLPQVVSDLGDVCALPSMAGRPEDLHSTAEWIAQALEESGLAVEMLSAGGPPVVVAQHLIRGKPTVLFYNHYDVQPPGEEHAWQSPPFTPRTYRRRLYARGAVDNKGNLVARIWALRAWRELHGDLPVGVRFLVEGEEEVGSPHLAAFIDAHADRVRADGCIWEAGDFGPRGRPYLYLGMKGLLSIELEAEGAIRDLHSGWATIAPNPAWRLVWVLSRLKSPNEEVLIDGFYDQVEGPSREEIRDARRLPFPEKDVLRAWQVPTFLQNLSGNALRLCQFYSPTCNISGIETGYLGPGQRTIIPARARARVDFRLVPKQRPKDVLDQLRRYLQEEGFEDITVKPLGMNLLPFCTSPKAPFARAVVEATAGITRYRPAVFPTSGGSGPMHLFGQDLGLPVVGLGVGHPHANVHGADENVRLVDLERGIVHVAAVLGRLAEGLPR